MNSSKYLWIIALVLLMSLSFYFYSIESFINSNSTSIIQLNKDSPVSRIELVCVREPKNDAWINLADITILDENENKVTYWTAPNSVQMANGNLGHLHQYGPIQNLYDGNIDTLAHSSTAPDKLTITLNPELKLGSIQITNRKDCCAERIQKYDMNLYNKDELIGNKSLANMGENGKSVTYVILKPGIQGPVGPAGPDGPIGPAGPRGINGISGDVGPIGMEGVAGADCEK